MLTDEQIEEMMLRPPKLRPTNAAQEDCDIWGKALGKPLTPEECAKWEPI